jgi:hypothetical protein
LIITLVRLFLSASSLRVATASGADDGALITRNKKLAQALKDAQKAINVALEWAREMGVEFSVEKTVVMLFTNKRPSSFQMPKGLQMA